MRGWLILLLFYGVGTAASKWGHVPLPGNMLGMLLLAAFLLSGIIKPETVEKASAFLLRHMLLFFVPILIGVTDFIPLLSRNQGPLLLALLIGPPLAMLGTGWTVQRVVSRRRRQQLLQGIGKEEVS
ncbi:CidA/LrgA family protein [Brevibacillus sp. SYP-B805]|uniref:CidA/LrgA family protein n=1 Tax=Brevibacillus sp. SYP-B805 TaxID=1578199 RepID=UPI0013EA15CC|nr:CidA/LrgA family protein [Brevibacillus sp. SYP-B805]NGQ94135.1 CidA/LrgA family protein [Brevibacillus sp. SYP-B805]